MTSATAKIKLPMPPSVAKLYAQAFWDPTPTTTVKSQRQLAYALGYPSDWRVERTVEYADGGSSSSSSSSSNNKHSKAILRDRIHATFGKHKNKKRKKSQYTWFHHEAAQAAAAQLAAEETLGESSHLLPPVPLFAKGDIIQVRWDGKWYEATITKRKKQADQFLYSVYYQQDDATQDEVEEQDIRPGQDPSVLAVELGFSSDWKASRKGSRYVLTAPTGEIFTTKKAALRFIKKQQEILHTEGEEVDEDVGDPPWRIEGHDWIGREIEWASQHKVSGTRKVKVQQVGIIDGYIKDTDVDKEGNPGFISESSGKPANLFHVVFPDQPHHLNASFLLNSQDMEESEVAQSLLEETPVAKRKREAALAKTKTGTPSKKTKTGTPSKKTSKSTPKSNKRRRR